MAKTTSTTAPLPQIELRHLRTFHARLMAWYRTHGRHDLPWRQTDDAYKIWLSEVMLQQTQVATVLARFYGPFLATFPTLKSLAEAPREKVMKAWEGLGYYRRAGFLHEAAKTIAAAPRSSSPCGRRLGGGGEPCAPSDAPPPQPSPARGKGVSGGMPRSIEGLCALPGIGRNTAHAIAAFAYRQPVAILEANVKRVVARIFALKQPTDAQLWAGAEMLLNAKEPFDYNQSMMDLGSMVCTPRAPRCSICPATSICAGKHAPEQYPAPKAKKKTPTREMSILVLEDAAGRYHLEARGEALLGGLYGFPQVPRTTDLRHPMREMHVQHWGVVGNVVHVYSHFRLEGAVVHGKLRKRMNSPGWYTREEIAALPLSGVDHKVLALLASDPGPST